MANLIQTVLGRPTGTVGDVVFRQLDGKTVIAVRPAPFMPGTDQESLGRRAKFRFAAKLAAAAAGLDEVKESWKIADPASRPFLDLLKVNYPYVDPSGAPGSFKLTPAGGFGTTASLITVSSAEIEAEIAALGDNCGINIAQEVSTRILSVVYLYNPSDPNHPAYDFIARISDDIPLQLESALIYSIPLMNQDTEKYNLYQNRRAYFAIVTLDSEGRVVHFSSTFRNN